MDHDEAIATLVRSAGQPRAEPQRDATEHVARCSDCWEVLSAVYEHGAGKRPPGADEMAALYRCQAVRDELYLLVGLGPETIGGRYPELARHLGWCHACRTRFGEILAVEGAAAQGDFDALSAPAAAMWAEVRNAVGETIRVASERLVIRVRRAAATFAGLPAGFLPVPVTTPAGVFRGASGAGGSEDVRELRFALADSGLWADVRLEPEGGQHVGLRLGITGGEHGPLSVSLLSAEAGETLLARQSMRGTEPVVVRGLRAGPYALDIHDTQSKRRFRVCFDVEPIE